MPLGAPIEDTHLAFIALGNETCNPSHSLHPRSRGGGAFVLAQKGLKMGFLPYYGV
jgi:hypothetical protein